MIAVQLAVELLILTFVGVFARKRNIVDDAFTAKLTNLMFAVAIPCLIFNSIRASAEFSPALLKSCALATAMGFIVVVLSIGIGHVFYLIGHRTGYARITRYALSFCHYSFMGIPVIRGLFGDEGMLAYSFFMIAVRIGYFTVSESLLVPPTQEKQKKTPREILKGIFLNPCLLAVILGLVFWVARIPVPEIADWCIRQLSAVCTPMGLLLCGTVLGKYAFRDILKPHFFRIPVLRCVMMPAVFFLITRLFLLLGADPLICKIAVIYSALPIPSLTTVYVLKYDPDPDDQLEAVGASVLSVVLSAATLPVWYLLLG